MNKIEEPQDKISLTQLGIHLEIANIFLTRVLKLLQI